MSRLSIQATFLLALGAFAVCAPAQEPEAPDEESAAEQAPPPPAPPAAEAEEEEDDVFVPSEELSAEDEVTFPVDI